MMAVDHGLAAMTDRRSAVTDFASPVSVRADLRRTRQMPAKLAGLAGTWRRITVHADGLQRFCRCYRSSGDSLKCRVSSSGVVVSNGDAAWLPAEVCWHCTVHGAQATILSPRFNISAAPPAIHGLGRCAKPSVRCIRYRTDRHAFTGGQRCQHSGMSSDWPLPVTSPDVDVIYVNCHESAASRVISRARESNESKRTTTILVVHTPGCAAIERQDLAMAAECVHYTVRRTITKLRCESFQPADARLF